MSLIYSRPRLKIPQVIVIKNKERKTKIILVIFIAFITLKIILNAVTPIFDSLCEDKAISMATLISNYKTTEVMKKHTYEEMFIIDKDENGNIKMIKANVVKINEITSDIAIKIQEEINNKGRDNIEIPLGSFTGLKLLAGRGPGIKIRISSVGNIKTDLKSEFISKGINQTLHRVYLQVDCEVNILTPFKDNKQKISNQILIAENIIVGNIPETYYNLERTPQNEGMDLMQKSNSSVGK